jgi:hypothetical protein
VLLAAVVASCGGSHSDATPPESDASMITASIVTAPSPMPSTEHEASAAATRAQDSTPSSATGAVSSIEPIDPEARLTQNVDTGFDPPFTLQIPADWTGVLRDPSAFQAYAGQEDFEITFDHTYRQQESVDEGVARMADTAGLVPGPVTAVVVGGREGKGFLGTANSAVRFLDSGFHTNHAMPVELFVIPAPDGTTITIFLTAEGAPQHGLEALSPLARRVFQTVDWKSAAP